MSWHLSNKKQHQQNELYPKNHVILKTGSFEIPGPCHTHPNSQQKYLPFPHNLELDLALWPGFWWVPNCCKLTIHPKKEFRPPKMDSTCPKRKYMPTASPFLTQSFRGIKSDKINEGMATLIWKGLANTNYLSNFKFPYDSPFYWSVHDGILRMVCPYNWVVYSPMHSK